MRFPPGLFWALLGPVIALAVPYFFALMVMWSNPSSSLQDRGAGVLLIVAAIAFVVELFAIPAAIYCLVRYREYLTWGNALVTAVAILPMLAGTLFAVSIMYGHG
jgi:hypothetical protein